ncbi:MAG: uroporphyrinogen decarboxylase family protein, partial [Anaerolineae bacterium]
MSGQGPGLKSWQEAHNADARAVWEAFDAGRPSRPPVALGTNARFFIINEELNPGEQLTFEGYSTDGVAMLKFQLRAAEWRAEKIAPYCDDPVGLPESFSAYVDLQTYDDAGFFGAPVVFLPHQVPDTRPILTGDKKHLLFDRGLPDPLTGGVFARAHRLHEQMAGYLDRHPTYRDRPVLLEPFGLYTCGPLTTATALRGTEFYLDLYTDPEYARDLLDFVVEGTIARIHAHRCLFGLDKVAPDLFFADDAIQMISGEMLAEFLLPIYRRLKAGLTTAERIKIHLCGDATRHFKVLKEELGVYEFETGYPVDFGWLRRKLGPEVTIHGGPSAILLQQATPEEVRAETKRIVNSGICDDGRFV